LNRYGGRQKRKFRSQTFGEKWGFKDPIKEGLSLCKPSHPKRWRIGPDEKIPKDADPTDYQVCNVCHPPPESAVPLMALADGDKRA
jgi:hypothetical protein